MGSELYLLTFYAIRLESMIGDVNLFLNDQDDIHCGEIEIMIAEGTARHKGCGLETLVTFMRYGTDSFLYRSKTTVVRSSHRNPRHHSVCCKGWPAEHA